MRTPKPYNLEFLLVLVVVLLNAGVAYSTQQQLALATLRVTQTHDKILRTAQLMESLLNAETGQRGYLITHAQVYLEPYRQGEQQVRPQLEALAGLLAEDTESYREYEQLVPLVNSKLIELKETIQLADGTSEAAARQAVLSHYGKNFMDQIRARVKQIQQQQFDIRRQRMTERDTLGQRLQLTLLIGTLLTVMVVGLAYYLNRRELHLIAQSQAALADVNAQLETRVAERTAQLHQANEELNRSNRELQDFAFVASNDLQEPLRKIQAFGDLLKQDFGGALGGEGRDFIERMQNASRRMERLIKDLLAYSRVTTKAQPFQPVDLNQIAQDVLTDLETRIRQTGGTVEVKPLPTLEADPLQMRQLLQNLIGNALKFHRPDVPPVVTITSEPLAPADDEPTSPMCCLRVADNGIGFDEKYLDRIFTPFQRLHGKNEFEGTGMGLALCYKVVARHGGTITAESQPNVGSTFIIAIPLTHPEGVNGNS